MRLSGQRSWPVFVSVLVVVILLVGIAILISISEFPGPGSLSLDIRRHLIQFLLVVALGAVATFLVDYLKKRAEQREGDRRYRFDTIKSLLDRLDSIYRRVKHTRQRLGFRPGHRADNEDEMWNLREEQEDLEQLGNDIETHERAFRGLNAARAQVDAMDAYLSRCWSEYKRDTRAESTSPTAFGERLTMFVESPKSGDSDFPQFSRSYHEARRVLVELLVPARVAASSKKDSRVDSAGG
jgi:hypothetical protein